MSPLPLVSLAARVRYLHETSGLDQKAMSLLAGLSQSHVHQLIHGRLRAPRCETLAKLARTFDVSLEWLVSGEGPVPPPRRIRAAAELARLAAAHSANDVAPRRVAGGRR